MPKTKDGAAHTSVNKQTLPGSALDGIVQIDNPELLDNVVGGTPSGPPNSPPPPPPPPPNPDTPGYPTWGPPLPNHPVWSKPGQ